MKEIMNKILINKEGKKERRKRERKKETNSLLN